MSPLVFQCWFVCVFYEMMHLRMSLNSLDNAYDPYRTLISSQNARSEGKSTTCRPPFFSLDSSHDCTKRVIFAKGSTQAAVTTRNIKRRSNSRRHIHCSCHPFRHKEYHTTTPHIAGRNNTEENDQKKKRKEPIIDRKTARYPARITFAAHLLTLLFCGDLFVFLTDWPHFAKKKNKTK